MKAYRVVKKRPAEWFQRARENPAATYSPTLLCAVPSAMRGLTSEFGMESGISPSLWPPGKKFGSSSKALYSDSLAYRWRSKIQHKCSSHSIHSLDLTTSSLLKEKKLVKPMDCLVLVSSTHYCAYTSNLSTGSSFRCLLGRPYLEGGLAFRCFQRLSFPHLATRLCPWQNNRHTICASTSVLSY